MKSFKEIEAVLFGKCNKELAKKDFSKLERDTYSELIEIAKAFRAGEITREQATAEKLRLNERYDLACLHWSTLNDITQFVVNGIWSAENTIEFAQFVASELMMLCRKVSNSEELIPYSDIIVVADRIVEKRMREAANEKREDGTKRNESREPYQMGIDT